MIFLKLGLSRADLQWCVGVKNRETIDGLFRLDHNTRLSGIEDAFKAIGAPLLIDFAIIGCKFTPQPSSPFL